VAVKTLPPLEGFMENEPPEQIMDSGNITLYSISSFRTQFVISKLNFLYIYAAASQKIREISFP